jgi:ankyrin repeat protein
MQAKGLMMNKTDANGRTIIHRTSETINTSLLKLMLSNDAIRKGVNAQEVNPVGRTALMNIVNPVASDVYPDERLQAVQLLIEHGAKTSPKDNHGRQVIHYAASSDEYFAILELLLQKDADVGARDNKGWTPLDYARAHDCTETVAWLLSNQHSSLDSLRTVSDLPAIKQRENFDLLVPGQEAASPQTVGDVDHLSRNVLHRAVLYARDWTCIAKFAESESVNVNAQDMNGQTALHLALHRLRRAHYTDDEDLAHDIVKRLVLVASRNLDFTVIDHWHDRALDIALRVEHDEICHPIVFTLLEAGAKPSYTPHIINDIFFHAILHIDRLSVKVVRGLLELGADILATTRHGEGYAAREACAWQIARDRGLGPEIMRVLEEYERKRWQSI